jgi:8-oxo-dGTP pyrophosphatase MutT (NUDIX family)
MQTFTRQPQYRSLKPKKLYITLTKPLHQPNKPSFVQQFSFFPKKTQSEGLEDFFRFTSVSNPKLDKKSPTYNKISPGRTNADALKREKSSRPNALFKTNKNYKLEKDIIENMKFEFSAGGIVYKKEKNQIYILVAQHSGHHGWVFPKGLIGDHIQGETKESTALREVQEETGVQARIIKPLTPQTYWYVWEGEKRKKTVYYFLMQYTSGDTTQHDHEMEAVEWLPESEVATRLTYPTDKTLWQQARTLITHNS